MTAEYIDVRVNGRARRFPLDKVKIYKDLVGAGAKVFVIYPSYTVPGEITAEVRARLLAHRLLTGDTVVLPKKDPRLVEWLKIAKSKDQNPKTKVQLCL
jgi:hypothetical protein